MEKKIIVEFESEDQIPLFLELVEAITHHKVRLEDDGNGIPVSEPN